MIHHQFYLIKSEYTAFKKPLSLKKKSFQTDEIQF